MVGEGGVEYMDGGGVVNELLLLLLLGLVVLRGGVAVALAVFVVFVAPAGLVGAVSVLVLLPVAATAAVGRWQLGGMVRLRRGRRVGYRLLAPVVTILLHRNKVQ